MKRTHRTPPCLERLEDRRLLCFAAPVTTVGGGDAITVADFNHDGRADVAVFKGTRVNVSLSNGDGTFRQTASLSGLTGNPSSISTMDVNGDGKLDILAYGFRASSKNSPNGRTSTTSGGAVLQGACLQSCGGYPPPQIVGTIYTSSWPGKGDGTFASATTSSFPTYYNPGLVNPSSAQADLNHDGILDVADLNGRASGLISVSLGNADGTYRARQTFPAGADPGSIAAGDFNGDGWIDLVVVNSLTSNKVTFSVLLNDHVW